jgi:hypothetical protein
LDTFLKHASHHKAMVATFDVPVGDWYYNNDATHNKNERIYMGKGKESILSLVQSKVHANSKKNKNS